MGIVYFIQGEVTRLVKIGLTTGSVFIRFSLMQSNSPEKLILLGLIECEDCRAKEKEIHNKFVTSWVRGEWFNPTDDLINFIGSHCTFVEHPKVILKREETKRHAETARLAQEELTKSQDSLKCLIKTLKIPTKEIERAAKKFACHKHISLTEAIAQMRKLWEGNNNVTQ